MHCIVPLYAFRCWGIFFQWPPCLLFLSQQREQDSKCCIMFIMTPVNPGNSMFNTSGCLGGSIIHHSNSQLANPLIFMEILGWPLTCFLQLPMLCYCACMNSCRLLCNNLFIAVFVGERRYSLWSRGFSKTNTAADHGIATVRFWLECKSN